MNLNHARQSALLVLGQAEISTELNDGSVVLASKSINGMRIWLRISESPIAESSSFAGWASKTFARDDKARNAGQAKSIHNIKKTKKTPKPKREEVLI